VCREVAATFVRQRGRTFARRAPWTRRPPPTRRRIRACSPATRRRSRPPRDGSYDSEPLPVSSSFLRAVDTSNAAAVSGTWPAPRQHADARGLHVTADGRRSPGWCSRLSRSPLDVQPQAGASPSPVSHAAPRRPSTPKAEALRRPGAAKTRRSPHRRFESGLLTRPPNHRCCRRSRLFLKTGGHRGADRMGAEPTL